jgi:hypothetical protein
LTSGNYKTTPKGGKKKGKGGKNDVNTTTSQKDAKAIALLEKRFEDLQKKLYQMEGLLAQNKENDKKRKKEEGEVEANIKTLKKAVETAEREKEKAEKERKRAGKEKEEIEKERNEALERMIKLA